MDPPKFNKADREGFHGEKSGALLQTLHDPRPPAHSQRADPGAAPRSGQAPPEPRQAAVDHRLGLQEERLLLRNVATADHNLPRLAVVECVSRVPLN